MTTDAQIALPDANDFLIPEPPGGQWRTATVDEHTAAFHNDRPCAYVEYAVSSERHMQAHFVVDERPAAGGGA